MTNSRISNQGEGSGDAKHRPYRGDAHRWTATTLVPEECLRVEVVIHQGAPDGTWCLAIEASNPHTKELLAKWIDPTMRTLSYEHPSMRAAAEVRAVLVALLDPDPF